METINVEAKVVKVTVLEDRAVVERRAELIIPAGGAKLLVSGLAAVAVDRSLQSSLSGGKVSEARIKRSWQKREDRSPDRTELERKVESLQLELKNAVAAYERAENRHQILQQTRDDVLRGISETAGYGNADLATWREQWTKVNRALDDADEQRRQRRMEADHARKLFEEANAALAISQTPPSELMTTAELTVEHAGGNATLTLRYLVPCAVWRPAYRATLAAAGDSVTVEAEGVVWQRTGEAWNDVELLFSTQRPTLGATPPTLVEDLLRLREKTQQERQVVEVSMREETIQTTGEGAGAVAVPEVPGVDDGGQPLTLTAPHRVTIPSDGAAHRVPLFQFSAPAQSELLAMPELSPLVHRVARFENKGTAPLLAGPVELVRTSGYVGRAQLKFAAPGEKLKLSFGSEDTLRVARLEETSVDTARLTGKQTTTHTVKLYVSNTGSSPVKLAIEERVPVSEVEQVSVNVLSDKTRPAPSGPNADGIVRYNVDAGPRAQAELVLTWATVASAKVVGV